MVARAMDGRDLKVYNERTMEVQFLRHENHFLRGERDYLRVQLFHVGERFSELKEHNQRLLAENQKLTQRVAELTASLQKSAPVNDDAAVQPPAFVKANLPGRRRRKKPGRKPGHPAALRPMPAVIDVHQDVPLPADQAGRPSCPACNACLLELEQHQRIVEDIIPAKVVVKCYHTASGWCPGRLPQTRRVAGARAAAGGQPAARPAWAQRAGHRRVAADHASAAVPAGQSGAGRSAGTDG